jgi:hypothetical protein
LIRNRRILAGLAIVLAVGLAVPVMVSAQTAPSDHFLFYKVKRTKGDAKFAPFAPILLRDQFGLVAYAVKKPVQLGLPADKNDEGIADRETHLKEYLVKPIRGTPKFQKIPDVEVRNQCTTGTFLEVIKPVSLLVPTSKNVAGATIEPPNSADHNVDHMLCYKVKGKVRRGTQVVIQDQFQSGRYDLGAVTKLCNPAAKLVLPNQPPVISGGPNKGDVKPIEQSPVRNRENHLVCYKAKLAKKVIPQQGCGCATDTSGDCLPATSKITQLKHQKLTGIFVNNQFGPERLDTVKEREFCIPSEKYVIPPPPPIDYCGDGVVQAPEQCDPPDDAACPGLCLPNCRCGIEIDVFPNTSATVDIITPLGSDTLVMRGPTTVHVDLGSMRDEGGRDVVDTEIVSMSLTGFSPTLNSGVEIRAGSDFGLPSPGQIQENQNDTPGVLDLPPFVLEDPIQPQSADSFFDVFFEVEVQNFPPPLHFLRGADPKHMTSTIHNKPPKEGDVYVNPDPIPLVDENGNLVPNAFVLNARHVPVPVECGDTYPQCNGECPTTTDQCVDTGNRCECVPPPPQECLTPAPACGDDCQFHCPNGLDIVPGRCEAFSTPITLECECQPLPGACPPPVD